MLGSQSAECLEFSCRKSDLLRGDWEVDEEDEDNFFF